MELCYCLQQSQSKKELARKIYLWGSFGEAEAADNKLHGITELEQVQNQTRIHPGPLFHLSFGDVAAYVQHRDHGEKKKKSVKVNVNWIVFL